MQISASVSPRAISAAVPQCRTFVAPVSGSLVVVINFRPVGRMRRLCQCLCDGRVPLRAGAGVAAHSRVPKWYK